VPSQPLKSVIGSLHHHRSSAKIETTQHRHRPTPPARGGNTEGTSTTPLARVLARRDPCSHARAAAQCRAKADDAHARSTRGTGQEGRGRRRALGPPGDSATHPLKLLLVTNGARPPPPRSTPHDLARACSILLRRQVHRPPARPASRGGRRATAPPRR